MLENELDYDNLQTTYYTDSKVVLGYISNEACRLHTCNRVQHIRDRTDTQQWHHVIGTDNPANEASCGLGVREILDNQKWFAGPSFLWKREVPMVNERPAQLKQNDIELKTRAVSSSVISNVVSIQGENHPTGVFPCVFSSSLNLKYFSRFSSWYQAKRWLALIKRGVASLKKQHRERPGMNRPVDTMIEATSVEELVQSEIVILRNL